MEERLQQLLGAQERHQLEAPKLQQQIQAGTAAVLPIGCAS